MKEVEWQITVVLSGTARGADRLGERWAAEHKIPIERYPAQWNRDGRAAGYIRNQLMSEHAEALVVFWDGKSRGTMHMLNIAKDKGLKIKVFEL